MRRMILLKGMGAALAVAVMAGPASAGVREYCDSYARDVAHRKTNSDGDVPAGTNGGVPGDAIIGGRAMIGGVGGTLLGTGATGDRYKRVYTNAFERCVNNYEGVSAASADSKATEPEAVENKATEPEAVENKVTETKVVADKVVENKVTETKVAVKKVTETKVATAANDDASAGSWAKACARKYRSWDPQKGKYKSYSGQWKPCRL